MKKISLLLAFLLLFTSALSLFTSAAVKKTAWYGESLLYCIGHNYTEGSYEESGGEECLTRGEFAHVLHSLADRPLYPLDDPDAGEDYIFPDLKFEDDYKDDGGLSGFWYGGSSINYTVPEPEPEPGP